MQDTVEEDAADGQKEDASMQIDKQGRDGNKKSRKTRRGKKRRKHRTEAEKDEKYETGDRSRPARNLKDKSKREKDKHRRKIGKDRYAIPTKHMYRLRPTNVPKTHLFPSGRGRRAAVPEGSSNDPNHPPPKSDDHVESRSVFRQEPGPVSFSCALLRLLISFPVALQREQAPENSTQFLMDDHHDCDLYKSFDSFEEKPTKWLSSPSTSSRFLEEVDLAQSFFMKDFEMTYHTAKEEYLSNLTKDCLIKEVELMERKLKELESKINSSRHLGDLQIKLLHLQEENQALWRENKYLKCDYRRNSPCSSADEGLADYGEQNDEQSSSDDDSCSTCSSSSTSSSLLSDCGSSCSECMLKREQGEGGSVMNGTVSDVECNGDLSQTSPSHSRAHGGNDIMVDEISSSKSFQ